MPHSSPSTTCQDNQFRPPCRRWSHLPRKSLLVSPRPSWSSLSVSVLISRETCTYISCPVHHSLFTILSEQASSLSSNVIVVSSPESNPAQCYHPSLCCASRACNPHDPSDGMIEMAFNPHNRQYLNCFVHSLLVFYLSSCTGLSTSRGAGPIDAQSQRLLLTAHLSWVKV